jgi:hypothetical protein
LRPPAAVAELGLDTDRLLASAALLHQRLVAPLAEDSSLIVFMAAVRTLHFPLPSPSLFLLLFKDKDLTPFFLYLSYFSGINISIESSRLTSPAPSCNAGHMIPSHTFSLHSERDKSWPPQL